MKTLRNALVLSLLSLIGIGSIATEAKADTIDFDTYAAVAYSKSTGKYGFGYNYYSKGAAERVALTNCTEKDAKIVGWVRGGWLVLAIGDDNSHGVAWEFGDGATNTDAKRRALKELKEQMDGKGKLKKLICICSGNIDPVVYKYGE